MRRARWIALTAILAVMVWGLFPTRTLDVAAPARAEAEDPKKVCADCEKDKAAFEKVRCEECKKAKEACDVCRKKGMTLHYLMHGNIQPRLKELNAGKDLRDYPAVAKAAVAMKKLSAEYMAKFLPDKAKDEEGNKVYADGMGQMGPALDGLKTAADKKDFKAVTKAHQLVTGTCMTCHNLFYERRDKRLKEEEEKAGRK